MNLRTELRTSGIVAVGALICLAIDPVGSQDLRLKPTFGVVSLRAGFKDDPHVVMVDAGGEKPSKEAGVTAWVSNAPTYRVNYAAGKYVLTIKAECVDEDTTLLINTPDGKWIANNDGENTGKNPSIRFQRPQSGQYDIWVGTLKQGVTPKTRLIVTERK